MTRTIIASLVAAALALGSMTPAAAQQQQNNENLARILAGTAGLVILGKVLSDRSDRDRERRREVAAERAVRDGLTVAERRELERLRTRDGRFDRDRRFDRRDRHVLDGPRDRRHVRGYDQCWREKWRGGKIVRYRDGQCMKYLHKGKKRHASQPRECLRKRWTRDGWVTYWSERCLAHRDRGGRHSRYRD